MSNGPNSERGDLPIAVLLAAGFLGKLSRLVSRLSRRMKNSMTIAALVAAAVLAGHAVSAQVSPQPLASLKAVAVPQPDNLGDFVKDKVAAISLGKSLFWDMQVGSDGIQSCASCHFHGGADSRSKNQLSPGLLRANADKTPNPDKTFNPGGPNYQLKPEDYPFHKLADPNDRFSTVLADTNDVTSSQGVFNSEFVDAVPGRAEDIVNYNKPDPDGFQVGDTNVRRVEPRNTPTVINAVFNFRNFWDGRAQNEFNGVNPFGSRDPNAKLYKAINPSNVEAVKVSLTNSSLASQAVGPPLSSFEMSANGRTFEEIGDKFGPGDKKVHSAAKGKKLPRETAKKMLPLRPLGKQVVHPEDSVLGTDSRAPEPGLKTATYQQLVEAAFKPEWWKSNQVLQIGTDGSRTVVNKPDRELTTQEYTLMEYNFPLFFGLAVQMYESTLVSDDTPVDKFLAGDNSALTAQQQAGLDIFTSRIGGSRCIDCHVGAELTNASVRNVQNQRLKLVSASLVQDNGFNNIGVTPTLEDLGVGDNDPFGNPLSEARLAKQGSFKEIFGKDPNITVGANVNVEADGAFKTPGLRNVELTAPYFHNGGQLTLRQVVDFYSRGGDFGGLAVLNLSEEQKEALVAFMKGLTDERVRYHRAPFDHPQLFVTNGHPGNQTSVTNDGTGKATDGTLLEIPAVGRDGLGSPLSNFLENS
jgi:cytochrome c peroxidase